MLSQPNEGFQFNIQNDPGYAFNLQQGQDAVNKSLAASGLSGSGAAAKALQQYSQNYASGQYQNAFQNYQTQLNNLFNQSGLGANAANAVSGNTNALNSTNTGLTSGVIGANTNLTNTQDTTQANVLNNNSSTVSNLLTGIGNARAAGTVGSANAASGALTGIANSTNQAFLYNLLNKNSGGPATTGSGGPATTGSYDNPTGVV